MTEQKRGQNLAKCCSVSFQSLMNQWKCSDVKEVAQVLRKNLRIIGSEMWYVFHFSCNIALIIVQSGFEAVRFHHISCGSWTEQVCNPRSHKGAIMCRHVRVWSNWRQNGWFELEQVISMPLRNKITVVRNTRIYYLSLLNAKHKTRLFSVWRLRTEW